MTDTDKAVIGEFKFRAFISYSSLDLEVGERFQNALERLRVPKPLRGRDTHMGRIGKRLIPIFRDRSDLEGNSDLSTRIEHALDQSAALVVLCSKRSSKSKWINREIAIFKLLGKGDRIFPVIIDGEPKPYPDGVFPPALAYRVDQAGEPMDIPENGIPLAADLREDGDGWEASVNKIAAGLLGVSLTELIDRLAQSERADRRRLIAVLAGVSALAMVAAVSAIGALQQRNEALITESKYLAREANRVSDETNDHISAMAIALEALPAGEGLLLPRPYVDAAERAFVTAATRNRLLHNLGEQEGEVYATVFSPDGSRLASASTDETARIWNLTECETGACQATKINGLVEYIGDVANVAFSSDGRYFATALNDYTIQILDLTSCNIDKCNALALRGHTDHVLAVNFSRDGARLISASNDGTARVWDLATCAVATCDVIVLDAQSYDLTGRGRGVEYAVFSPGDDRVLTVGDLGDALVWDLASCEVKPCTPALSLKSDGSSLNRERPEFSPDGQRLITIDNSTRYDIYVWDLTSCNDSSCSYQTLQGHQYFIESAKFSADGASVVSASEDKTARVWNLAECKESNCNAKFILEGHQDVVNTAVFSHDGDRVLTASGRRFGPSGDVRVWDLAACAEECPSIELAGHSGAILAADFSSTDSDKVATGSSTGEVRVWNVAQCLRDACPVEVFEDRNWKRLLTIAPNAKQIATNTGESGTVLISRLAPCTDSNCPPLELSAHIERVDSAAFSSDGLKIVTVSIGRPSPDRNNWLLYAYVWDLSTCKIGGCSAKLIEGEVGSAPSTVPFAFFSPDGEKVLLVSGENAFISTLSECQNAVCPTSVLRGHRDSINDVSFSQASDRVVTAANDGDARIWNLAECRDRICDSYIVVKGMNAASFSPDARYVVSASLNNAMIWDLAKCQDGVCTEMVLTGHNETVRSAKFSPDGKRVVTTSDDRTSRIWDISACSTNACQAALVLEGHQETVTRAIFSPDANAVLTSSEWDRTARLWDASTGAEIMVLDSPRTPVSSFTFLGSGDGAAYWNSRSNRVELLELGHAYAEETGNGRLLAVRGCDALHLIGVRNAPQTQRERALLNQNSPSRCEESGLLSSRYYKIAWCNRVGLGCEGRAHR